MAQALVLAPEDIPDEALAYLSGIMHNESSGNFTVAECIKIFANPQNEFERAMQLAFRNDYNIKQEIMQKATTRDCIPILREIIDGQMDHITESLEILRETDPGEYNKIMQGYIKIAHPQQKEVNVNVEVEQKVTMYQRMQRQYGYSAAIEDAEVIDTKQIENVENRRVSEHAEPILTQTPSQRLASTFDPMFFEQPQGTTPPIITSVHQEVSRQ